MKYVFFIFIAIGLTQGCKNNIDVDAIINKYDTTDFSVLKNRFVHFRSAGKSRVSSIYFISDYKNNCSPYAVEVNNSDKKIIDINNSLVLSSCGKDYLKKDEIVSTTTKFLTFNLLVLGVDSEGNVYISP